MRFEAALAAASPAVVLPPEDAPPFALPVITAADMLGFTAKLMSDELALLIVEVVVVVEDDSEVDGGIVLDAIGVCFSKSKCCFSCVGTFASFRTILISKEEFPWSREWSFTAFEVYW